jgi:hypothetical protein
VELDVAVLKVVSLLERNSGGERLEMVQAWVIFERALILFPPEALAAAFE